MASQSEDPFSINFRGQFQGIPKRSLPDDCVEYSLYVLTPLHDTSKANDFTIDSRLHDIQDSAEKLAGEWTSGYIWQREGFHLEFVREKDGIPSFLRGRTEFGDAIDDEWIIVGILRELSRRFSDLWIQVIDSDGQFLLIEAVNVLPRWVQPEIADNRAWINSGNLLLIDGNEVPGNISLKKALQIISQQHGGKGNSLKRIRLVEEEAFYRIRKYPKAAQEYLHYALLKIPRKVALILKHRPEFISAAVEQFYLRDPINLKVCKTMNVFNPEDSVEVSVKFTKILYAQLRGQEFEPPVTFGFQIPPRNLSGPQTKAFTSADIGMKLACGFEMLLSKDRVRMSPREDILVQEITSLITNEPLPTDSEISALSKREDSDSWLDINYFDFEKDLKGIKNNSSKKPTGYGDKEQEEKVKKLVERFEAFLNEDAGMEGVEFSFIDDDDQGIPSSSDSEEDRAISFDEEEFERVMREMMGLPPPEGQEGQITTASSLQILTNEPEIEHKPTIQETMAQVEAELKQAGVLESLESPLLDEYGQGEDGNETVDESIKIDFNLAKNMLESFKSQAGLSGPGGNLLASMGISLPRDEVDRRGDHERQYIRKGEGKGKKRQE